MAKRVGVWACTASTQFSSTVRSGKRLVIWKVRARPRAARRCAGAPVTSWPNSAMRPEETGIAPEIRLKSVVFPAPLGPMSARRSPGRTSRLTRSTACRPPKDRHTASRRRAGGLTRSAVLARGMVARVERRLQVLVRLVLVELADGGERGDHRVLQPAADLLHLARSEE